MGIRQYTAYTILATATCIVAFILTIIFINPQSGKALGLILFYLSLFLSLLGVFSLLGLMIRLYIFKHELPLQKVKTALRQSFWISSISVISLILQSFRILAWWNIFLLLIAFMIFEALFILEEAKKPHLLKLQKNEEEKK